MSSKERWSGLAKGHCDIVRNVCDVQMMQGIENTPAQSVQSRAGSQACPPGESTALAEPLHVPKNGAQSCSEFTWFHFRTVERILLTPFSVHVRIGGGDDQLTIGSEQPTTLFQKTLRVLKMLNRLKRNDQVQRTISQRNGFGTADPCINTILQLCVSDGRGCDIDAYDGQSSRSGKRSSAIAFTAGDVSDIFPLSEGHCEAISFHVLPESRGVNRSRNHAFTRVGQWGHPGEAATPRTSTPVWVLLRQAIGPWRPRVCRHPWCHR